MTSSGAPEVLHNTVARFTIGIVPLYLLFSNTCWQIICQLFRSLIVFVVEVLCHLRETEI